VVGVMGTAEATGAEGGEEGIFSVMSADVVNESLARRHAQHHAEQAARRLRILAARIVVNLYRGIVLLRNLAYDRQAQSAACCVRTEDAIEAFEYVLALSRCDAGARIFHFEEGQTAFFVVACAYRHAA